MIKYMVHLDDSYNLDVVGEQVDQIGGFIRLDGNPELFVIEIESEMMEETIVEDIRNTPGVVGVYSGKPIEGESRTIYEVPIGTGSVGRMMQTVDAFWEKILGSGDARMIEFEEKPHSKKIASNY